ncbi:MAG: hypothetical protein JSW27_07005 [Phycisphaerales bacterium]|nr:MAG: hypothetical protein JSW27_07005 [Phycisphaerales bacterium]
MKLGPEHSYTFTSPREFVRLYESWGKPDEATKWQSKLPQRDEAEE